MPLRLGLDGTTPAHPASAKPVGRSLEPVILGSSPRTPLFLTDLMQRVRN